MIHMVLDPCTAREGKEMEMKRIMLPDSSVSDDADGHPGGEAGEAAGESGGEVRVAVEEVVWLGLGVDPSTDDDSNDEAVDTEHTSHDHGHDGLHDELRAHDTHGRYAYATLGCPVRRPHACKAHTEIDLVIHHQEFRPRTVPDTQMDPPEILSVLLPLVSQKQMKTPICRHAFSIALPI